MYGGTSGTLSLLTHLDDHTEPLILLRVLWIEDLAEELQYIHDDVIKWKPFSALLALCVGNSPVIGEFPSQRPVARSFAVFFDMRLNKRLNRQSIRRWFETPLCPLWRHCNINKSYKDPYCAAFCYGYVSTIRSPQCQCSKPEECWWICHMNTQKLIIKSQENHI